jgi:hypothetical protein
MWEQDPRAGWQLLGTALAVSSWPVYLLSLVCAIFRVRLPHLATPKEVRGGNFTLLVLPQLAACVALGIAAAVALRREDLGVPLARVIAAGGAIAVHVVAFRGVIEGWRRRRRT